MKEVNFSNKFIEEIYSKFPYIWGHKIHINEMQSRSIPDYIYCINGIFVALEFKIQRDGKISITPGQIREINNIKNANGVGLIVGYDEKRNKILIRDKRLDYKAIFLRDKDKAIKSKSIRIDWDFELNHYEDAIGLIEVLVKSKGG
jgi:Holliday junction resolvase